MSRFDPRTRLRRAFRSLRRYTSEMVHRFGRQTEEVLSEEPIDLSSPSIPYYENLANRFGFARVVLYMVLLVFVVVTMISNTRLITYENLYFLAKDIRAATTTARATADQISYPISSETADFATFRGGLVVAGAEVVTAVSASGRQTLSVNVDYTSPVVRTSDKYFLTFGRGEHSFAVYNAFVQVHRETTEFPVYDAAVAATGSFAVVTRSRDYTSEVILYHDGAGMERIAAYHLGGYVTSLAYNPDGNSLAILSVESVGGMWETKITMIRIGSRITMETATFAGTVGTLSGFVTNDRLAAILSDRLVILKTDASVAAESLFAGNTPTLAAIGHGRIIILSDSTADLSDTTLTVYDRNASPTYTLTMGADHPVTLAGGADDVAIGADCLYLRAGATLYCITLDGKLSSLPVSRDTVKLLTENDGDLLVCTPAYAYRTVRKDFPA